FLNHQPHTYKNTKNIVVSVIFLKSQHQMDLPFPVGPGCPMDAAAVLLSEDRTGRTGQDRGGRQGDGGDQDPGADREDA
ncbi:hypothetical protein, partial [Streptomyces sp. NPDC059130]|uniref:hypothetical protein n=1 Tax=Streptomyces sp. NPDC059130 TaxID=3346735 RepID=UPI0036885BFB